MDQITLESLIGCKIFAVCSVSLQPELACSEEVVQMGEEPFFNLKSILEILKQTTVTVRDGVGGCTDVGVDQNNFHIFFLHSPPCTSTFDL